MTVEKVGVNAISFYYPKNVVDQSELERFDGVGEGKYTKGLGQIGMSFCADNEDVNSLALTATKRLLEDYQIDEKSIGCLVVGTETIIDKSKSVKTILMDLFPNNTDIEGCDVKNACFGGVQALFHAVDWIYANYELEQRNAIVVLTDIAIYEKGPARCTGGAGAIALLITPNAAIHFQRPRAIFAKNNWDFYKPIGHTSTEYPIVDGKISLGCYVEALNACYDTMKEKSKKLYKREIWLDDFSAVMLHCPFTKLVQKSVALLALNDAKQKHTNGDHTDYAGIDFSAKISVHDRETMTSLVKASGEIWKTKTDPFLVFNKNIGNMYTPSLFAQLIAYLGLRDQNNSDREKPEQLLFFAYGSGSISAMFAATLDRKNAALENMIKVSKESLENLTKRQVLTPQQFTDILEMRERFLHADAPKIPESLSKNGIDLAPQRAFYLDRVDAMSRRFYKSLE
ncbi:hypothetical protein WR25_04150 [Diploscapter pachys]|uniref:Hydroxymethylglutaryl-CoA synthase n=1 Tax=Diploscapter pachys TaxID=2018661 RepID=A0A2A2J4V1_9BILA|nr:hypothetical protein WR25_04150 [Diploscapter pachys]